MSVTMNKLFKLLRKRANKRLTELFPIEPIYKDASAAGIEIFLQENQPEDRD